MPSDGSGSATICTLLKDSSMAEIIEVSVTLHIAVADASDGPALALRAAEQFSHVSHAQIAAFNEVNRVHSADHGTVEAVTSIVAGAGRGP